VIDTNNLRDGGNLDLNKHKKPFAILVYQRPGFVIAEDAAKKASILNAPMLDISSTIIRKMVASGKSIRYMVPESVNEEILKSGYYK
jgi:nicotinate-nucleotide adenylyltransferase